MKLRETLLGLVVLALIAGGVIWARMRVRGNEPGAGDAAPGRRVIDPLTEAAMPDVTLADGSVDLGDVRLVLSVAPRPILAFTKNRFRVRAEANSGPVALEAGRISFEMSMPMGDHRYTLAPGADGWHEAEAVLPLCKSGKRRWFATVVGTASGKPRTALFRLDLTPPGDAPPH
ncbi:MAG: hypothetical protein IPF66_06710 [Holophagales bacterium]|nr:hypothetical protein [Holophagales bacterium]